MPDVSMVNSMASMATNMKSDNVGGEIGAAILKQIMDMQKMQGEALVKMMQQTPSPDLAVGGMLDVSG
jgi:hypothetical protein